MRSLFLILVLAVAYTCAESYKATPESMACRGLLKPIETKEAKMAVLDKCIAAQPGLQATIDELTASAEVAKSHPGCKKGRKGNPARLLKAVGKTTEVDTLNKCMAKENGHLVVAADGKSSFDVAKFKGEIKAKVAGTSSQANTQLGLDKCPEADLVAFDVYKYMQCVQTYCATGAAPVITPATTPATTPAIKG